MKKYQSILIMIVVYVTGLFTTSCTLADDLEGNDLYISGYSRDQLVGLLTAHARNLFVLIAGPGYTSLDATIYRKTVHDARDAISKIMKKFNSYPSQDTNAKIALITEQLADIPYLTTGAMGEGDWQPGSSTYVGGAVHIQQDPVYRLDGLDCQTFVQVAMALLHANNLDEFDRNILNLSYGAAGNPNQEIVHFYNRNHFASGDFNPVNEKNGNLSDVTAAGGLAKIVKTTSAIITRNNWFLTKQQDISKHVRVLSDLDGPSMVDRFKTIYSKLDYPHFYSEQVSLTYLPKEQLAIKQVDGGYQPNQAILDQITVPAVVEIVRDVKQWNIGTKNIKDSIGSELNVSHMGLLYRQTFKHGETIFQKIACFYNEEKQKVCNVKPIICQENQCQELMFAQATSAYPDGYYWYEQNGSYLCSPNKPQNTVKSTSCNRVERLPLAEYITRQQYMGYPFMGTASIIGIHVEKIN